MCSWVAPEASDFSKYKRLRSCFGCPGGYPPEPPGHGRLRFSFFHLQCQSAWRFTLLTLPGAKHHRVPFRGSGSFQPVSSEFHKETTASLGNAASLSGAHIGVSPLECQALRRKIFAFAKEPIFHRVFSFPKARGQRVIHPLARACGGKFGNFTPIPDGGTVCLTSRKAEGFTTC